MPITQILDVLQFAFNQLNDVLRVSTGGQFCLYFFDVVDISLMTDQSLEVLMDGLDVFPLLFFVEFVDVLTIKNFPLLLEHFEVVVVVLDKEFGPGRDV